MNSYFAACVCIAVYMHGVYATCGRPHGIENGRLVPADDVRVFPPGATVTYLCNDGFKLIDGSDSKTLTCVIRLDKEGNPQCVWNGLPPRCVRCCPRPDVPKGTVLSPDKKCYLVGETVVITGPGSVEHFECHYSPGLGKVIWNPLLTLIGLD